MKRQTFGYVVALWLSCSPDYKSGVTECNTDGKCPSGYVCGAASTAGGPNVCYSQTEAGGGGGSGGASGSTGPKTECTTDGKCPNGFICGGASLLGAPDVCYDKTTANCGGSDVYYCPAWGVNGCWSEKVACSTVVDCGNGQIGACPLEGYVPDCLGSGKCALAAGGAGGSGGTGGSTGTNPCAPSSTDTACDTCLDQSCCPQLTACLNQTACTNLVSCEANCASGDTTCMNSCKASYPSGTTSVASFLTCIDNACSASCSGGSGGGGFGGNGGQGGSYGGTGGTTKATGGSSGSTSTCPPSELPKAGGTCNVFPACGCPTGQACSPNTQATGLKCFPSGSLGEGADCTSGDCASGLGCFGDVCKRYCQFDSDCPAVDSAQSCVQTTWSPEVDIQGVLICTHVCDPVSPHSPRSPLLACPVGFGCSAAGTSYPGATDCEPQSGSGVSGSSCSADSDCTPGFYCSNGGTCIKYCSTSADCPASSTCHTFSTPEYAGTTSVGYCSGAGADASVPDARAPDARVPDARPPDSGGQTCPTPAAGGTCNVFPACGCPTGQVCYPNTQATGLTCVTTAGLGEGAACNGKGCAQGLGCFGGVCKKYCQSASDCTAIDSAQSCVQTTWSAGVDIQGVLVCARVCDPVFPQNPRSPLLSCPVGFGCTSMNIFPGASDCVMQSGSGISGSTCSTDDDCTPGYYCSVGNTCIKYCYTAADCPTGMTCASFTTTNYAGTTQVNHCR